MQSKFYEVKVTKINPKTRHERCTKCEVCAQEDGFCAFYLAVCAKKRTFAGDLKKEYTLFN